MLYQLFINQLFILFHVFLALEVGEAFRRSVYDPAWRRLRLGPIKISEPPHVPNLASCKKSTIQDARFCYSNESNECLYDHMPALHFQSVLMYHEAPIEIVLPYSTNKVCLVALESHPKNDAKTNQLYVQCIFMCHQRMWQVLC